MASKSGGEGETPKTMREIVQSKVLNDVIGSADAWKVLVMDDNTTRIISSACTMFDIMERRVTLVEKLSLNRQPFAEMDVVYYVTPTVESVRSILNDFPAKNPRYGNVHLIFSSSISNEIMGMLQSNSLLLNKIKTLKEIHLEFISTESNVFHMDLPNTLSKFYGSLPDPEYPALIGRKLATLCITLNEHPNIRYQNSSRYAKDIAESLHQTLLAYKRSNKNHWCNGDDNHTDRDRAQILILDRTFDPLSPLMHEYTYQAMANDLLPVAEGVISYSTSTNGGKQVEKKAILSESDELWSELRYSHIAKVIDTVRQRMNDIIQNNAGAALQKKCGADMSISAMGAALKELPEFNQTMGKLSQHVNIAQQCMDAFTKQGIMDLTQVEQTVSTGVDEDGKEVKGSKLKELVLETLQSPSQKELKIRLLAIYFLSQKGTSASDRKQLIQAAKLTGSEQQILMNFDRIVSVEIPGSKDAAKKDSGFFSSVFKRTPTKYTSSPEGEYSDTRHVGQLKGLLDQMMTGELPIDKFPAKGPSVVTAGEGTKSSAKSVRKYGANSRWGRKDQSNFSGGRYLVFVAGGVGYAELRYAHECMQQNTKEIIIGGTSLLHPDRLINDVANLDAITANSLSTDSNSSSL